MPRPVSDPTLEIVSVRLGADTRATLDEIAAATGGNRTTAVRFVVDHYRGAVNASVRPADPTPPGDDQSAEVEQLRAEVASLRADLERARAATLAATQRDHGTRADPPATLPPRPARAVPGPVIPDTPRVHRLANPVMVARMARQRDLGPQG